MSVKGHSTFKASPTKGRSRAASRWVGLIWAIGCFGISLSAPAALAGAGSLDPTFGGDGRVTTDFGSPEEDARALALQPDGKIVVIASSTDPEDFFITDFLLRYDSGGALDPSFDGDGLLVLSNMRPNALAIQSDGKIVVAGTRLNDFAVVRVNADGTSDTTFSDDGLATADFNGGQDAALALALRPNGKVIVVGSTAPDFDARDFAIARFNSDGTLDLSFSGDGLQRTSLFGFNESANAVAVQLNGKIVVAGTTDGRTLDSLDFGIVRYRADGTRDPLFSQDGRVRTSFSVHDEAFDVGLQADGKILVGGSAGGPAGTNFALARYTPRGRLDATFSKNGKQQTDFSGGDDEAHGIAIQGNGRIVLAGSAAPPRRPDDADFGLARYRPNGNLDLSFSVDGKQRTRFGTNHQDYGFDAALQSNGRIVVVGAVTPLVNQYDIGLARYLAR